MQRQPHHHTLLQPHLLYKVQQAVVAPHAPHANMIRALLQQNI
jgi:hypothetical protein